jgi:FMN-dependent NADH-azoreductase
MAKLLYIQASPKDHSHSGQVARKFLEAYAKRHPDDTIKTIDLMDAKLPPIDAHSLKAKYNMLHGLPHQKEEAQAWKQIQEVFKDFSSADKYVLSVPMWNFNIPYPLKHYIDVITQPGLAFKLTPEGTYRALVTGKPAVLIYASGGIYESGTGAQALAFQKPYMKTWLQFIGFKDIKEVVADSNLMSQVKSQEEKAIKEAIQIAASF